MVVDFTQHRYKRLHGKNSVSLAMLAHENSTGAERESAAVSGLGYTGS